MKKVLYFALVALLALPLMFSCKPKNDPEDEEVVYNPEKPDEGIGSKSWFDYWTEGEEEDAVEIDIKNLTGVWQLRAEGVKYEDPDNPNLDLNPGFLYDLAWQEEEYFYYYEIKEDFTDTLFVMKNSMYGVTAGISILEKYPGTWQVIGKKLTINRQRFPGIMDDREEARKVEFSIYLLEKDRMVWLYDNNCYVAFVRAEKPKEPKTRKLTEVLTEKKWKISNDYQLIVGCVPNPDPKDPSGGTYDTLSVNKNMWKDYQLEFKINDTDSILTVYDYSGTKVEEYAWSAYGDNVTGLTFQFKVQEGNKLFSEYLNMEWLDFKDYNKTCLWSWEPVEKRSGYDSCDMQRYFEIEGVK